MKKTLKVDWDTLFTIKEVEIAGVQLQITPMSLLQLASVMSKVKGLVKKLVDGGASWENFRTPEQVINIMTTSFGELPELLSDATGYEAEEIARLPLEENIKLLEAVIDVNISSRESLEKNFASLAEKLGKLATPVQ